MKNYTVKETLEELNISRATFYNKIKLKSEELKEHITFKEGKKYISSIGVEILRKNENDNSKTTTTNLSESEILIKENDFLKTQIDFLQSQLTKKDDQIKTLCNLVENSQVLLKNEQETKLLVAPQKNIFSWFKKKDKNI